MWVLLRKKRLGFALFLVVAALIVAGEVVLRRAAPILKARVIETLSSRFHSRIEIDSFNVSVLRGLEVSGDRLRIYPGGSGVGQPLIAVEHFQFHSGLFGLILTPTHVSTVHVTGMQINIPPRETRERNQSERNQSEGGKSKVVVDKIVCDSSRIVIGTSKPDKDPRDFEISHIELRNVGANAPWRYDAKLVNAIPRGDIHAEGTFGPWQTEDPGASSVTGNYTFDHADLGTIKGIGGILSSVGKFEGQLNKIEVEGSTETPEFSLDTANHAVPLHTQFQATVDGTTGDTFLHPVRAKLRNSNFTASGAVVSVKGKGHSIDLDVDIPNGQIQDFLDLAVRTQPAFLTGVIGTKTKLHINPGKESVANKLKIEGSFTLESIHFSNSKLQDNVDMLSLRAQGEPSAAKPGVKDVVSRMGGRYVMDQGVLQFTRLAYALPGANVSLDGLYSLDGDRFDFHGLVRTEATLAQMVASPWKSFLLKAVSPFFKKNGAGAEIPVSITGTKSEPKFGLDVHFKSRDRK